MMMMIVVVVVVVVGAISRNVLQIQDIRPSFLV